MSPPRRVLPLLLACLLAAALTGCSRRATDPLIKAGQDLFRAFDPAAGDAGFGSLNQLVVRQSSLAAAVAAGLVHAPDEHTRYAAVYVLGLTATEGAALDALRRALDDETGYLRAVAAGALIGLGETAAIPVLIELLTTTDEIPGSTPSTFVDRFASDALTAYTGEDFGAREATGGDERAAAQQRWRDWWESVRDTIEWDAAASRYET